MMKRLLVTPLALLLLTAYPAVGQMHQGVTGGNGFIENRGQWAEDVLFMTPVEGGRAWVTRTGIVYDFFEVERGESSPSGPDESTGVGLPGPRRALEPDDSRVQGHVVRLAFEGGEAQAAQPEDALTTRLNYFLGDDPTRHASNVPVYEAVTLRGLYAGVDLQLTSEAGAFSLSFQADDAAALAAVRLGTTAGDVIQRGEEAVVTTNLGNRTVGAVHVEMRRGAEAGLYVARINGGTVEPDRVQPVQGRQQPRGTTVRASGDGLLYSTFLGVFADDVGTALAVDASGAAYVTGTTFSSDFPTTPGAYDASHNGFGDAFVAKLSPDGSALEYATFLGGGTLDGGVALVVNASGAAHVTGTTFSSDFPTTPGAYDASHNEDGDAFVAKLSPDGSALEYATFLGGDSRDDGYALALDASGAVYVTGETNSSDLPATPGAYDTSYNGGYPFGDAFVAKLSPDGSALEYATFLGGGGPDGGTALALDASGAVYVTGFTGHEFSSDFPTTPGAYDTSYNGGYDAFVAKLSPDGSTLEYSTFLGGDARDYSLGDDGNTLALDASGAAYVTGQTFSSDFPATPGAYDTSYNEDGDAFVAKLQIGDGGGEQPDLVPLNLTVSPTDGPAGSSVTVSFTVQNQGSEDAPATQTNVRISTSDTDVTGDDPLLVTLSTPVLGAGASEDYVEEVVVPEGLPEGAYHVWVITDVNSEAGQENESNDRANVPFTVTDTVDPLPDLVPLELSVSPTEGQAGTSATVSFTVRNQGGADASATQTNVRLSPSDTEVTVDDPLLGTLTTPALAAGAEASETLDVTIPSDLSPGTYHVWVTLDANSTAGQSNEANDTANVPFTVTGGTGSGVSGTLVDLYRSPNGGRRERPLVGAIVQLYAGQELIGEETSDANGAFMFGGTEEGSYRLRVIAEGTHPITEEVFPVLQQRDGVVPGSPVEMVLPVGLAEEHYALSRALAHLVVDDALFFGSGDLPLPESYQTSALNALVSGWLSGTSEESPAVINEAFLRLVLAEDALLSIYDQGALLTHQLGRVTLDLVTVFVVSEKVQTAMLAWINQTSLPDSFKNEARRIFVQSIRSILLEGPIDGLVERLPPPYAGMVNLGFAAAIDAAFAELGEVDSAQEALETLTEELAKDAIVGIFDQTTVPLLYVRPTQGDIDQAVQLATVPTIDGEYGDALVAVSTLANEAQQQASSIVGEVDAALEVAAVEGDLADLVVVTPGAQALYAVGSILRLFEFATLYSAGRVTHEQLRDTDEIYSFGVPLQAFLPPSAASGRFASARIQGGTGTASSKSSVQVPHGEELDGAVSAYLGALQEALEIAQSGDSLATLDQLTIAFTLDEQLAEAIAVAQAPLLEVADEVEVGSEEANALQEMERATTLAGSERIGVVGRSIEYAVGTDGALQALESQVSVVGAALSEMVEATAAAANAVDGGSDAPVIVITGLEVPEAARAEEPFDISVTLRNAGVAEAEDVRVELAPDSSATLQVDSVQVIGALSSDEEVTATWTLALVDTTRSTGVFSVRVTAANATSRSVTGTYVIESGASTSNEEPLHSVATGLHAAYPNPAQQRVSIPYSLQDAGWVRITLHDVLGRQVALLIDERKETGRYLAEYDGARLSSGVYLVRMATADHVETRRITLIR